MINRTPTAAAICLAFSLASPLARAASHAPIVINSDSEFTAANGVSNPGAAGTAADPYIIPGWTINGGGTYCVQVNNTTKYFELRNIGCSNAVTGIVLAGLKNAKVLNSSISQIRGNYAINYSADGIGILVSGSNQVTLSGNAVSNVSGQIPLTPGAGGGNAFGIVLHAGSDFTLSQNHIFSLFGGTPTAGSGQLPNGGFGGWAIGIFNPFGLIIPTVNLTLTGNRIEQLFGATGGAGASTGTGGDGGMAVGVYSSDAMGLNANTNTILNLTSGAGGGGGSGSIGGGNGNRGGFGANAIGLWVSGGSNIANQGNTIQSLSAGAGGNGGAGGFSSASAGGTGGDGAPGGEASAMRFDYTQGITTQNNILNTINAGRGGNGGSGGFGLGGTAHGGNGGNGGPGTGLHYQQSSSISNGVNTIANNHGGAGGTGAPLGGLNGAPGSSLPILFD